MHFKAKITFTLVLVSVVTSTYGQQCSSDQFTVKNKNGEEYLNINSPTEVKTCGGINICDEINKGKQELLLNGNNGELSISNGNTVLLPDASNRNEIQTLSINGGAVSLSNGGGSVELPDSSTTNEIQSISLVNNTLTLSNGGRFVDLSDVVPLKHKFYGFSATTRVGGYQVQAGIALPLHVPLLEWDTFPNMALNGGTGTFNAPFSGFYQFNTYLYLSTGATSNDIPVTFTYLINGNSVGNHAGGQLSTSDSPQPSIVYIAKLNAGNVVSLQVYCPIAVTVVGKLQGQFLGQ